MPLVRKATLTQVPEGISVSAARPGEQVNVAQRALVTSDDGPHVYQYLDSMMTSSFAPLLEGIPVEQVTGLLINIVDGKHATGWINPPLLGGNVIPREALKAGDPVGHDQLLQIAEVSLGGVAPEPSEGAIVYACRVGWRTGLYFDFSMLRSEPRRPIENLRALIGQVHTILTLRQRLKFTDFVLKALYEQGWFPFIGLPMTLVVEMYNAAQNKWPLADLEAKVVEAVSPRVPVMVETWKGKEVFLPLVRKLSEAARHFANGEYEASHDMALPCVEGVLRHMYLRRDRGKPDYKALRDAMVRESYQRTRGKSALLPEQFSEFLDAYHLAPFDLGAGLVPPSRHSAAHGVSSGDELSNPSHALRVFLTLEQIFFYV
jgi:hypothetical protein